MKLKVMFIILIGSFNLLNAQVAFPDLDANWCYKGLGDTGEDLGIFCFNPSELIETNGETYSKISFKPHPYDSYEDILYREEDGRFYVIPQDSINEILVYDFNLEVGDTFQTDYGWGIQDSISLTVQNIDTIITLDGVARKLIILENEGFEVSWLEGIGSLDWVFVLPIYQASVSGGYIFVCHSQAEEIIYLNGASEDCGLIDQTNEATLISDFEIFPNPVDDTVNINLNDTNVTLLKIIDLSGNVIFQKSIESNEKELQLFKELEAGLYLIQVVCKGGTILTKRFTKM